MKFYALLPMVLLGACVQTVQPMQPVQPTEETGLTIERETMVVAEKPISNTQVLSQNQTQGQYVERQPMAYNQRALQQQASQMEYMPQTTQMQAVPYQNVIPAQVAPTVTPQGTTIEVPAQQIYIPDSTETYNQAVIGAQTVQQTQNIPSYQPMQPSIPAQQVSVGYQQIQAQPAPTYQSVGAYSQPEQMMVDLPKTTQNMYQQVDPMYATQPVVSQPTQPEAVVITLQHPAQQGTLAQCLSTDMACIASYEQQGFVQLRNMPQFAGFQEVLSPSDYPAGQWRNQNNIPRW